MAIRKRAQFSPPAQMARPPAKTPALRADAWAFNSSSAEQTTYKIEIPQKRGFR
jgi:hypothetical protein